MFNHTKLLTPTFNASCLIVPLSELAYRHHTGDCTNTIQPMFALAWSPQVRVLYFKFIDDTLLFSTSTFCAGTAT